MPKKFKVRDSVSSRSTGRVFRKFSTADDEKYIRRLKRHTKRDAKFDIGEFFETAPEFYGWYVYTRNNLKDRSWREIEALMKAGFFNAREKRWLAMYHKLTIFKEVMGHTRVPARWNKNLELAHWVHGHRGISCRAPEHLKSMLEAIGFEWRLQDQAPPKVWEEHYAQLVAYKERFGNCDVPARWPENKSLGSWVSHQRLNKSILSEDQIMQLDDIGFDWDILGNRWEDRYAQLVTFYEKHGHSAVPATYTEIPGLALWVANVRYRPHAQSKERLKKLNMINFSWDPYEDAWQHAFFRLRKYRLYFGDTLVPITFKKDPQLAIWVSSQRHLYKKGKLHADKIKQLDRVGFVWDVKAYNWDQKFKALESFKERFGHCRVPAKSWAEDPSLGNWLSSQRSKWDRLPSEQRERLEALGVERKVKSGAGSMPANVSV